MNARNRCQLVAGCLLLSTFAMGLGSANLAARPQSPAKTIEVLVAKRDLRAHERLTDPVELFTTATFRAGEEPVGAFSSLDDVRGMVLRRAVVKGHPIARDDIFGKYAELPEGLQAVGVRIEVKYLPLPEEKLPGQYVDIILHYEKQRGSFEQVVLVRNVLVLAGSSPCYLGCILDGREPPPGKVLTFALAQKDVLTVIAAKEMGQLQLVLSNR